MLKSDFGKVDIKGIKPLIMAELGSLIYALRRQTNLTDEELRKAINDGFMNEKELDNLQEKIMNKERTTEEVQDLIR